MASRDAVAENRTAAAGYDRRAAVRRDETKPSFMTTEFYVFLATIAGILIAAYQLDNLDAERAATLCAAVSIGYMISRGLAKVGSAHRHREDDV